MTPEPEQTTLTRGFAALSSLASDVQADINEAMKAARSSVSWTGTAGTGPSDSSDSSIPGTPSAVQPRRAPPPRSRKLSARSKGWILGGLGTIAWIGFALAGTETPTNQEVEAPEPSAVGSATQPSVSGSDDTPFPTQTARPNPFEEEIPPVGTGTVLSAAQLRYCLSEDVRLTAAKDVVNEYLSTEINRFNLMVDDFNNRCSRARYYPSTLKRVQPEVEGRRMSLQAEGAGRF